MATMNKRNVSYDDALKRWMQDPDFRAEYEALEPAYQIARRRIEKGLTQEELADLIDTKQPSIARLESGRRAPSLAFLRRVADALDCRVEIRLVPLDKG